jgi:Carboxypeptidase regulatory-like domain
MSRLCRLVLLVLVSCAVGGVAMAQQTTGDIRGTVTDSSGAVVPGVKVTIARAGTGENRSTQTNSSGDYEFNALEPGHYSIRIENRGFKTVTIADLVLVVGDHARMDAQLQVGNVSETVPVSAAVPALETQNATLSSAVTEHAVQDLPLNGRNYITLAQDTAGANPGLTGFGLASGSRPDDRRQDSDFSVNGQSDVLNNELIDGMDNNERIIGTIGVRPSIDAIQEFRVETNLYSTDTTRTAGGVVNIVTKSGSNQFHGSLYEFFRNDVLDARNFFANTGPKPELRQNQYGGSLGGPIKKGKTFFFGDYEGFRQIAGQTEVSTVPTLFEEQNPGNFTDIGGPDVSGSVTPVGLNYFKLYPAPNRSVSHSRDRRAHEQFCRNAQSYSVQQHL